MRPTHDLVSVEGEVHAPWREHHESARPRTRPGAAAVAGLIGLLGLCTAVNASCPPAGSGKAGVDAWAAANCSGPASCVNPATTCNGDFTINFLGVTSSGSHLTYTWEVCHSGAKHNLSHWAFGMAGIDCLAEGFTLGNLVVGATKNGDPAAFAIGLDPTTQIFGLKFDVGSSGGCDTWAVTLDPSVLAPGSSLGVGCVLTASKAGNQDITRADRASPGYACIMGPVCTESNICWKGQTAWSDGSRYTPRGNWATFSHYAPDLTVTLFAGQTFDAGTVHFSAVDGSGNVTITVTLNAGFRFEDRAENLKVQGYASAPSGNPAPGLFAHKDYAFGSSFSITVPAANYYGVHVNVEMSVPCDGG